MAKAPLVIVKDKFESKEKLVAAVEKLQTGDLWVDRVSGAKGLGRVSNAKLLRLHALLSDAKERFGTRDKLVGAILELEKRQKDKALATALGTYSLPRLIDLHRSLSKKTKAGAAKPAPAKAAPAKAEAKPAAEKKTPAKKAPAKKS